MNLKKLVTSNDENDLRLAAHLFYSDELDTESERLFTERLAEPRIAQFLTEAVGLHTVGALSPSSPTLTTAQNFVTPNHRVNVWALTAIAATIAVCCVWYVRNNEKSTADQTRRVAELWASQLVQSSLESSDPEQGDSHSIATHDSNGVQESDSSANMGEDEGDDLAPPSWLLAAALLPVEGDLEERP